MRERNKYKIGYKSKSRSKSKNITKTQTITKTRLGRGHRIHRAPETGGFLSLLLLGVAIVALSLALSGCAASRAEDIMEKPEVVGTPVSVDKNWVRGVAPQDLLYAPTLVGEGYQVALVRVGQGMELRVFNGTLQEQTQLPLRGSSLTGVALYDANGDGVQEAFLGVADETETETELMVLDLKHLDTPLFLTAMKAFVLSDLQGKMRLYTVAEMGPEDYRESYMNAIDLKTFDVIEQLPLGILYYVELFDGRMPSGQQAIFFSAGVGAHSAISDAVVADATKGKALATVFYKTDKENLQPYSAYYAACLDVANNGIIAFPFMDASKYNSDSSMAGTIWLTRYAYFNGQGFDDVSIYHDNYYGKLKLEQNWVDNWEINRQGDDETIIYYDYVDHGTQDSVMTIYYLDELQRSKAEQTLELEELATNGNFSALVKWGEGVSTQVQDQVRQNFKINEEAELYR